VNNFFLNFKLKKIISYYSDLMCLGYFDPDDRENAYKMMGYLYKSKNYPKTHFNRLSNDQQRKMHVNGFRNFIFRLFNQTKGNLNKQNFLKTFIKCCEFFMFNDSNIRNNYEFFKLKNKVICSKTLSYQRVIKKNDNYAIL